MSRTRKKSEHYVNNKEFLEALIVYRTKVKAAQEAGEPLPRITNYLGECFLKNCHPPVLQTKLCKLHVP